MCPTREEEEIIDQIYEIVDGYIKGDYGEDDVLAITPEGRRLSIIGDRKDMINITPDTDIHPLSSLQFDDDNGGLEPDLGKIADIAHSWALHY